MESSTPKFGARSALVRYALAACAAVVALVLRQLLSPLLGNNNPYHTVWMAVIFAAWYCGIGPSIVTVLMSWLGVYYFLLPPQRSFALQNPKTQITGMLGFIIFSCFIIALGETNRRARTNLEREILERKATERALREDQQLLRIAQKASRSGSWESNYKTGQVTSSPELRELYGFPPEHDDRGREGWRSLIAPEDLASIDRYHADLVAARGAHYHVEFRIHRKDGAVRWLEATAQIFYDDHGCPERIVGVATDVSERKLIEERERRLIADSLAATAKFRAVFEQTSVFAGITTLEGTVIDANQLCLEACGYRAEEALNHPLWQTPWWRMSRAVQEKIRVATAQAAQGVAYREILTYHWADGTERLVDFALHPIRDSEGQIIFLHPTGVDITDLKRTEEHLRKAQEDLENRVVERTGELAETVASLEAEMLVRKKVEQDLRLLSARVLRLQDEERRRIARDLHDSTGQTLAALRMTLAGLHPWVGSVPQAASLLREADHLSDQALQEIRTTSYLLHPPLLDEVGFSSAAQWYVDGFTNRSSIVATLRLGPVPQLEKESELALFRILQESLSNVHRHAESSRVEIQLAADQDNVILSIRDFGRGMPAEKFASFRETGTGVGVGLGGMKQRVRELGGHLRVESSDEGTCVIATVPLSRAQSAASNRSNLDHSAKPAA